MKNKKIGMVFFILAAIWMGVIFSFSRQNGSESSKSSDKVVDVIIEDVVKDDYYNKTEAEQHVFRIDLSYAVRKSGHFFEYALLELLLLLGFIFTVSNREIGYISSTIIVLLYAISDELHQSFVGERSPAVRDVTIDTFGGVMMLLVFILLVRSFSKKNKKIS